MGSDKYFCSVRSGLAACGLVSSLLGWLRTSQWITLLLHGGLWPLGLHPGSPQVSREGLAPSTQYASWLFGRAAQGSYICVLIRFTAFPKEG